MSLCTKFLWHKWGLWETRLAAPEKYTDGKTYRQLIQIRKCKTCGYTQEEWLNSAKQVEPPKEKSDE